MKIGGMRRSPAPTRGYILAALDHVHEIFARRPIRFIGLSNMGATLGIRNLPPPAKQHR
jgi:hypothetical protein